MSHVDNVLECFRINGQSLKLILIRVQLLLYRHTPVISTHTASLQNCNNLLVAVRINYALISMIMRIKAEYWL